MKKYVNGFLFDMDGNKVAMIRKNRPQWQAGKLNGIGGHVEEGEDSLTALVREFREETGVETHPESWDFVVTLTDPSGTFSVDFFRAFGTLDNLKTITDEEVVVVDVESITPHNAIPNLMWLIPMAKNMEHDIVDHYRIEQVI